ncbi:membrane protein [Streptomyces sannanensis]|uniref:Membrane protein n=1 Tax=Streptomyces sannanensis TaxID=285536 RepID=A0ABP6SBR3_9ACTN
MGIESDQLVYDYLSRVGDLAQQRQLPSAVRMRLVATLREEIDRRRSKSGPDSPAAVRRILGRLGTPDEVVSAASEGAEYVPPAPSSGPPVERTGRIPRPRREAGEPPPPPPAASPPHLAGEDELGPSGSEPDWWRVEPVDEVAGVGGFVGGVEVPEILKPPRKEEPPAEEAAQAAARRPWWRRVRKTAPAPDPAPAPAPARANPFLLLAAVLLVAGAFLGSWLALAGGWLLAYGSRRLSRAQMKLAVLGLPGLSLAGGVVWVWGRVEGRWGAPVPEGGTADALADMWPVVVRVAAVLSALFLAWRAKR